MHKEENKIIYSPSDLTLYMDSPFASWMEHKAIINPELLTHADPMDEMMILLQNKGAAYEKEVLESFLKKNLNVVQIKRDKTAEDNTYIAMQDGTDVIYQAALSTTRFKGYADFLIKVEGQSGLGNYYYEVWDTKLSKTLRPYVAIQLCCYAEMLEMLQGRRPEYIVAALGSEERERLRTDDYFYYYQNLKSQFLKMHRPSSKQIDINPADSSNWGRWSDHAKKLLKEADHLSQIATITKSQIKKLEKAGIGAMQKMADTDSSFIKGIDSKILNRLKEQARIQKNSKGGDVPLYKILPHAANQKIGLSLLPPSSPLDIYFDIEGFPLEEGGLEYLWGLTYFDKNNVRQFKDFWAHNKEEEKESFKAFIEWTYKRWLEDPTMHIYHYANYEIAACRKLMGRYGVCEYEVDQLLRNEVFIDLYKIVKGGLLLGEPRYSIKNVEHLYRSKRSTDVGSGGDSVVVYERWRANKDGDTWKTSKILNSIREYNIDDCNSTQELVEWLRLRQEEEEIKYLGISEVKEPELQEEITDSIKLKEKLLKKADQLKDQGNKGDAEIHSLFAHILEFHGREKKPIYWRLFDRMGLSDYELIDDIDCLASCVRTNKPPYKLKPRDKKYIYEYEFELDQEFKGNSKQYIVHGSQADNGKNINVELVQERSCFIKGIVALKSSQELDRIVTLIPYENINDKVITEAIKSQAELFLSGDLENTAINDFLLRRTPNITNHKTGDPIVMSDLPESRLKEIIKAICSLNNSYLTIQGAPGSGKTYTGKHVIAELLKLGKKIGISSNSHKAINNLLINTAKYCNSKEIEGYFICTQDTDEELNKLGISIYKNGDIMSHLEQSCVIGTTAWGFAKNDLENAFDYLFVDEAGQVSVANLIAMSRSAKNIILMGDQMQLGQPSQGSHPGDSGLSILEYLLHDTPAIDQSIGVFLKTTYRMHSYVNSFISNAIYEGKLESASDNDIQRIKVPIVYQGLLDKEAGIVPVSVCHEGNTQSSQEEVDKIALLAKELIGRIFISKEGVGRLIDWSDILFIAPYNHQVSKLKSALGDKARVGSVDKFQGQEAPIVFLSMCSSNANESARGMDFLFNKNRINVAVSRSQCLAIIVYSKTLLETSASNLKQLEMVNLFCKLVGRGK